MSMLTEILQGIHHQSSRLHHYYLGVEHLFLALLALDDSLTARILKRHRQSPEMIYAMLEDAVGKSLDRRYWEGFRATPRYTKVLSIAESYSPILGERELLLAILDEGDSLPARLLTSLGLDIESLSVATATWTDELPQASPPHDIRGELPLSLFEKNLLQEHFTGQLSVSAEFLSDSHPMRTIALQASDQHYLVRFDHPAAIFREKQRVENYMGSSQLIFIISSRLGFVAHPTQTGEFYDLLSYGQLQGWQAVSTVLQEQVAAFLKAIQPETPQRYRFGLWREYEGLLPPALSLEAHHINTGYTIYPLDSWSRDRSIHVGASIQLQDFTVRGIYPHRNKIMLGAGSGDEAVNAASKIDIFIPEGTDDFSVGQSERDLRGIVIQTRDDILREQVNRLKLDFPVNAPHILTPLGHLPNPLFNLSELLQLEIDGTLSVIHGSLEPAHILVDDSGQARLLNYQHTRFGHLVLDWVMLELELWTGAVLAGEDWESIWATARLFQAINAGNPPAEDHEIPTALHPILSIRQIAAAWIREDSEYHAALLFVALAKLQHTTLSLAVLRLNFILSALACDAFYASRPKPESESGLAPTIS